MASDEVTLWRAYRELRGFAQDRIEAIQATGFCALFNCWSKKPLKPRDFLPLDHKPKKVLSWNEGHKLIGAYLNAITKKKTK